MILNNNRQQTTNGLERIMSQPNIDLPNCLIDRVEEYAKREDLKIDEAYADLLKIALMKVEDGNSGRFMTEYASDSDPFGFKVDEATDYYRDMIFGDMHYYGPLMDAVLHEAIRRSLNETDEITIEKLSKQLDGPHPSEFDKTVSEGLRDLIWERVQEIEDDEEMGGRQ